MLGWLRRTFITGFFVTVPLVVSVVAIVWMFRFADRLTAGLGEAAIGRHIPGLGIIATAIAVLIAGLLARNVIGRRLLRRGEQLLLHVPVFRTIYAPVKQLMNAFSPDNESGFKRVVLVELETPARRFAVGFLTREFTADRGHGPEPLLAVYVPTNNLYLGDVIVCAPERVTFPELTVEEGIRVFLTGGMGLPETIRVQASELGHTHAGSPITERAFRD
jgi:uncharacterized membrane protein